MSDVPIQQLAEWLIDTFMFTGALIALVLLVRQKVARWFGPQVAYALWALPLLRLFMPPLVLPASLAPRASEVGAEPLMIIVSDAPTGAVGESAAALPGMESAGIGLTEFMLAVWLAGAALFLILRTRQYLAMRHDLLAGARPVGEAGRVRLVETHAVDLPLAFGVRDKVVALPPGFMALYDLRARDLAIAHELAHHRGHDLLANVAAQLVLALHWFNPLAWAGWRAMRKDQEAACDARVVAGRARSERIAYAEVIAGFAAGERLALTAPLACPMLGEKSIIHRLRSLTMSEISARRRRGGIATIVAGVIALPLTASISYAQPEAPEMPAEPEAPAAPRAPAAPPAREAELREALWQVEYDGDASEIATAEAEYARDMAEQAREYSRDMADRSREYAQDMAERAQDMAEYERDMVEYQREMAEFAREMAEMERETRLSDAEREDIAQAVAQSRQVTVLSSRDAVAASRLNMRCTGDEPVIERELADGRTAIMVCDNVINQHAVAGLREARNEVAKDRDIPAGIREQVVRSLDQQIATMRGRQVSLRQSSAANLGAVRQNLAQVALRINFGPSEPPAPPVPPRAPVVGSPLV